MLRPCRASSALMSFPICGSSSIVFAFRGALRGGQTERAEPYLLTRLEGIGKRPDDDKQNNSRPNDVSLSSAYSYHQNFADFSRQRIRA